METKDSLNKRRAETAGKPPAAPADKWEEAVDRRFVWEKNIGDFVIAKFCGLRAVEEDGEIRRILDLDLLDHNLTMEQAKAPHCCMYCKGNLFRRLSGLDLNAGDTVKIVYNGKVPGKSAYGNIEMHDFSVSVKRA